MKLWTQLFTSFIACALLALSLVSCSSGGSDGGGTTTPPAPAAGSVTVTGTVSGTVIKVLRADTGAVISTADTASLVTPPFPFSLLNIPVGLPIKVYFFSAGEIFPLYIGTTNVFTVLMSGSIDLGFVTMSSGRATPANQPPSNTVQLGLEDQSLPPQNVIPPSATLTVITPAPATGSVIVDFAVQNFSIGGQGQSHLHITVDGGATHHFFNGSTKAVKDGSGNVTPDVVWQSISSFRLNGLSVGSHSVTVKLATASNTEFTNPEAIPLPVNITITNPPSPPATLNITPLAPGPLPSGPVLVSFAVQNFVIGGQGTPHLHIYLDGGTTASHFFNGATSKVLNGSGQPVVNITWQSTTSFTMDALSIGSHTIRLRLADGADQELQNAEAKPPDLNFSIQPQPGSPTLTINSPAQGANLPTGPVIVQFDILNSPVTTSTQPRMHFYVDNDTVAYKFYDGPGIGEEGSMSGVRYQSIHTHFVHWKSGSSIQLNALGSGPHQVRFVLVDQDQAETELTSTQTILAFTITAGTGGVFSLQQVVNNLNFPAAMATAPDGRIFANELQTGNIRVVTPTTQLPWQLQVKPLVKVPVFVPPGNSEMGLLGIAVDPNFINNHFVYVYYTATASINRVGRYTVTTDSNGDTVAASSAPTVIFDNIPASTFHNGGIINFGPDGMLYIFVGENDVPTKAQAMNTLGGKILRINPNGSIPSDNPFPTFQAPFSAIYSLGHRNSFGFTFHPHTKDLWQTENGEHDCDQINRIVRGGNYGWPIFPCFGGAPQYIDPIITFGDGINTSTIAPTGIVGFREDSIYPVQYHNNLLFADFNNGRLHRIELTGAGLTDLLRHTIVCDCGKSGLLSVMHGLNVPGQDGYIYVSNGDSIFRVVLNNP